MQLLRLAQSALCARVNGPRDFKEKFLNESHAWHQIASFVCAQARLCSSDALAWWFLAFACTRYKKNEGVVTMLAEICATPSLSLSLPLSLLSLPSLSLSLTYIHAHTHTHNACFCGKEVCIMWLSHKYLIEVRIIYFCEATGSGA